MWLFTETGFLSVVRHSEAPDVLVVRARDEESLRGPSEAAETQILATPENDYPYRLFLQRDRVALWMLEQVSALDYTNYKTRVQETRGTAFSAVLGAVWATLHTLTELTVTEQDRQRAKEWYPNQTTLTDEDLKMMKHLGHL